MRRRRALLALAVILAAPVALTAQGEPPRPPRDSLEAQVRTRMSQILKNQLGLSDPQVRQLQQTNRRFEGRRRALLQQERGVRGELRQAIEANDSTRVGPLLDQMFALQRSRLDLTEAEQKELATFLTPLQRARLFGMEEQIRRRMTEMRDARQQRGGQRPPPGGPPGRRPPSPRPR